MATYNVIYVCVCTYSCLASTPRVFRVARPACQLSRYFYLVAMPTRAVLYTLTLNTLCVYKVRICVLFATEDSDADVWSKF